VSPGRRTRLHSDRPAHRGRRDYHWWTL